MNERSAVYPTRRAGGGNAPAPPDTARAETGSEAPQPGSEASQPGSEAPQPGPPEVERLFLAIVPDHRARSELETFARELASRLARSSESAWGTKTGSRRGENVRWTPSGQYHVTLKFLGDTTSERRAACCAAARRIAAEHAPFEVAFAGLGAFPDAKRPSILWIGVAAGKSPLVALATELDRALAGAGFEAERRPYAAHMTIGRVRGGRGAAALAATLAEPSDAAHPLVGSTRIDRFVLMASEPGPGGGVRYRAIEEFPLLAAVEAGAPR